MQPLAAPLARYKADEAYSPPDSAPAETRWASTGVPDLNVSPGKILEYYLLRFCGQNKRLPLPAGSDI
jgi:hypothetical protein